MRKIISLFLAIGLCLMAGCQGAPAGTTGAAGTTAAGPSTTAGTTAVPAPANMNATGLPIVKEKVTYNFMGIQHDVVYKDLNELGIVKAWEKETNIDFVFNVVTAADKVERVNLAIATNNLPDVFYGSIATDLVKNGSTGIYLPVEKLISQWSPNIQAIFKERPDIKTAVTAPDGHIYGFPKVYETGQHNSYGYYVHMDWLKNTGLAMPATTDELLAVLRAMKGKDLNGNGKNDEYPIGFCQKDGTNNYAQFYLWFGMPAYGVVYVENNKTIKSGFTHEGYKDGLKYVRTLYEEGLCDPEVYTQDVQAYRAKVKEYKYGSFFMFAPYNAFGNEKNKEDYRYELVPAPKGPKGTQGWLWGLTSAEPNAMVLTKSCKNPEIMARFADYCADTTMSLQLSEGLLGQNLLKNDDGTYSKANPMKDHEIFAGFSFHMVTKERFKLLKPGFFDTQRIPRAQMYEPVVKKEAIFPLIMATPEESEKIAELQTEIMNYVNQKQAEWVTKGGVDADWDKYVAQLNAMKLPALIAIYQAQYDRYLANK